MAGRHDQEWKFVTDEVLKGIQAAEESVLQSHIAKARMAANALGHDPPVAKQAADLQSEIGEEGCGREKDREKLSGAPCGTKVAPRGKGDQEAETIAEGRGSGPSCAHRS